MLIFHLASRTMLVFPQVSFLYLAIKYIIKIVPFCLSYTQYSFILLGFFNLLLCCFILFLHLSFTFFFSISKKIKIKTRLTITFLHDTTLDLLYYFDKINQTKKFSRVKTTRTNNLDSTKQVHIIEKKKKIDCHPTIKKKLFRSKLYIYIYYTHSTPSLLYTLIITIIMLSSPRNSVTHNQQAKVKFANIKKSTREYWTNQQHFFFSWQ